MAIDNTKIQKVKTAMDNRYENKQSNKKTSISGSYTGDNDSYPTVLACLNKFGELITSWSAEASDSKYPSEKLVKTELDKKIDKSSTVGLVKNDGSIDTNTYITSASLPTKTSDLTNDGADGTNSYVATNDSRLTDARTPTSHTHGNLSNDGKLGSTANKPVITTTGGAITTGSFGTSSNTFAEGNHNHDGVYLKTHQSLSDIGGIVTVEKQTTAESGYFATYVIKQGTSSSKTQVGEKINIPKDYLVKSATLETCTVPDTPVAGYVVGDKYLDFVINTKDSSGTDNHLYILVSDLIDTYTADNSTLQLSNNQFSVKNGGIGTTQLASGVVTSLGYANNWNSSPAKTITSQQINDWDTMVSGGISIGDVDNEINSALDALAEAIYPTS